MASPFHRTMRSLEGESRAGGGLRLVVFLALAAGWALFLRGGRIAVYASTSKGRVEVSRKAHRVAATEGGRVIWVAAGLGRPVAAGEVLLRLDPALEQRRLDEQQAKVDGFPTKLAALRRQIEAEENVRQWQGKVAGAAIARARIDLEQRERSAATDEKLQGISERLRDVDVESEVDHLKAVDRAADTSLQAASARVDVERLAVTQEQDERRSRARLAELERQQRDLEAERAGAVAAVETARAQIALLTVRAPVAGTLGNIAPLELGDVIKPGDPVATVIPGQDLQVVALFTPSDAVGRIVPGLGARVRLDGFAWTQFGTLEARVAHLASEPIEGVIRVELRLRDQAPGRVPLQHGMPGAVEIEVERVSPWILLTRAVAGRTP
jgi:multidrug resistance efflux pump